MHPSGKTSTSFMIGLYRHQYNTKEYKHKLLPDTLIQLQLNPPSILTAAMEEFSSDEDDELGALIYNQSNTAHVRATTTLRSNEPATTALLATPLSCSIDHDVAPRNNLAILPNKPRVEYLVPSSKDTDQAKLQLQAHVLLSTQSTIPRWEGKPFAATTKSGVGGVQFCAMGGVPKQQEILVRPEANTTRQASLPAAAMVTANSASSVGGSLNVTQYVLVLAASIARMRKDLMHHEIAMDDTRKRMFESRMRQGFESSMRMRQGNTAALATGTGMSTGMTRETAATTGEHQGISVATGMNVSLNSNIMIMKQEKPVFEVSLDTGSPRNKGKKNGSSNISPNSNNGKIESDSAKKKKLTDDQLQLLALRHQAGIATAEILQRKTDPYYNCGMTSSSVFVAPPVNINKRPLAAARKISHAVVPDTASGATASDAIPSDVAKPMRSSSYSGTKTSTHSSDRLSLSSSSMDATSEAWTIARSIASKCISNLKKRDNILTAFSATKKSEAVVGTVEYSKLYASKFDVSHAEKSVQKSHGKNCCSMEGCDSIAAPGKSSCEWHHNIAEVQKLAADMLSQDNLPTKPTVKTPKKPPVKKSYRKNCGSMDGCGSKAAPGKSSSCEWHHTITVQKVAADMLSQDNPPHKSTAKTPTKPTVKTPTDSCPVEKPPVKKFSGKKCGSVEGCDLKAVPDNFSCERHHIVTVQKVATGMLFQDNPPHNPTAKTPTKPSVKISTNLSPVEKPPVKKFSRKKCGSVEGCVSKAAPGKSLCEMHYMKYEEGVKHIAKTPAKPKQYRTPNSKVQYNPCQARPYNRYNIFYILERERTLQSRIRHYRGQDSHNTTVPGNENSLTGYEYLEIPDLPLRYDGVTMQPGWYLPGEYIYCTLHLSFVLQQIKHITSLISPFHMLPLFTLFYYHQ